MDIILYMKTFRFGPKMVPIAGVADRSPTESGLSAHAPNAEANSATEPVAGNGIAAGGAPGQTEAGNACLAPSSAETADECTEVEAALVQTELHCSALPNVGANSATEPFAGKCTAAEGALAQTEAGNAFPTASSTEKNAAAKPFANECAKVKVASGQTESVHPCSAAPNVEANSATEPLAGKCTAAQEGIRYGIR
jgi:hypothetical protein